MPQVDLETLVTACTGGGGDRKIACETLAETEEEPDLPTEVPSDYPPESFWLSKDAELDWFDRNAFLERNESTKGNSNSAGPIPTAIQTSSSSSQRFSANLKSIATIFGLPRTQKTTFADPANRRISKPMNARLFPKRSESISKSAVTEPSSPKVSCMGRVRSKRGVRPSALNKSDVAANQLEKSGSVSSKPNGIFRCAIFRSNRKPKDEEVEIKTQQTEKRSDALRRKFPANAVDPAAASEPPGLGAMTRFASGRRSTSMAEES